MDSNLKIYIKRLELIEESKLLEYQTILAYLNDSSEYLQPPNITLQFQYELDLLKAFFKLALNNHTLEEKRNFLNNFSKLIPPYFANYLLPELDKQSIDQKIRLDLKYLDLMKTDLQTLDLEQELDFILPKLKGILKEQNLALKREIYNDITQNLTPQLQYILDKEPMHKILLKAHLNFLSEFIYSLDQESNEEFKPDYNVLIRQLEIAEDSEAEEDQFKVLDLFEDESTKFGRFLKIKLEEYKLKYYED